MNKIIFSSILLSVSSFATQPAYAQLRSSNYSPVESLKNARKEMEVKTENQILEKLEAARLEDEKNRRAKFESLNFSVVNDGSSSTSGNNNFSSQNSF